MEPILPSHSNNRSLAQLVMSQQQQQQQPHMEAIPPNVKATAAAAAPTASTRMITDVCVSLSPIFGLPLSHAQASLFKMLSPIGAEVVQNVELFKFQPRHRNGGDHASRLHSALAILYMRASPHANSILDNTTTTTTTTANMSSFVGLRCKCCCGDAMNSLVTLTTSPPPPRPFQPRHLSPTQGRPVHLCLTSEHLQQALKDLAVHMKYRCRNPPTATPQVPQIAHLGTCTLEGFGRYFAKTHLLFPQESEQLPPPPQPQLLLQQQQQQSRIAPWVPPPESAGRASHLKILQQRQQQLMLQQEQQRRRQQIVMAQAAFTLHNNINSTQQRLLQRQQQQQQHHQILVQQQQQLQSPPPPPPQEIKHVENNKMYCELDRAVADGLQDQFYAKLQNRHETIASDANLLPWSYFEVESPFLVHALECLELVRLRSEDTTTTTTTTTTHTPPQGQTTTTNVPSTLILRCKFCHGTEPLDQAEGGTTQASYEWIVMNHLISGPESDFVKATASLHVFSYQHTRACNCIPSSVKQRLSFVTPLNGSEEFKKNAVHLHKRLKEWSKWIDENYIQPYHHPKPKLSSITTDGQEQPHTHQHQDEKEYQPHEVMDPPCRPVSPITVKSPDTGVRVPLTGKLLQTHDINPSPSMSMSEMAQARFKKYVVERPLNTNDVVFGLTPLEEEWGTPKALVGNGRFRTLISKHRKDYVLSRTTKQRKDVARSIVATIRRRGGFLRRLDDGGRLHKLSVAKALEVTKSIFEHGYDVMQIPLPLPTTHGGGGRGSRVLQVEVAPHYDVMDGTVHYDNSFDSVKIRSVADPHKDEAFMERKDHPLSPSPPASPHKTKKQTTPSRPIITPTTTATTTTTAKGDWKKKDEDDVVLTNTPPNNKDNNRTVVQTASMPSPSPKASTTTATILY